MAVIVFRGVEVQVDPSEFCAEFRKLFVDESGGRADWPKPLGTVKERVKPKGTIADIVRTTFNEVGVTKTIKANGDSAIRAAFYAEGWTAKVIRTNKARTFNVIRKS
jgi:hypothetical protein